MESFWDTIYCMEKNKKILVGFFGIIFIAGISLDAYAVKDYLSRKEKNVNLSIKKESSSTITVPTTIPITNRTIDPIKIFLPVFTGSNYKVMTSGKIVSQKESVDPKTGVQVSGSFSLDLNNGILYVQKGKIVRIEKPAPKNEIFILKDNFFYWLKTDKTYSKEDIATESGKFFNLMLQSSLPFIDLINDSRNISFNWSKINNSEFQTDWNWIDVLTKKEMLTKVKVVLDEKTNLITKMSFMFDGTTNWQDADFSYVKLAENDNSYLQIPNDYIEKNK